MAFLNFFKSNKNTTDNINVTKVPQKSIADGTMAAGDMSGAVENLSQVLKQQQAAPQILVVGTENFSINLVEYALKMGKRLDCQIIAVNATTLPLTLTKEQHERAKDLFFTNAAKAGAKFSELAASIGVSFTHSMEINEEEQIIREVAANNPGVRYVLTEPEPKDADSLNTAQIPVFDLACSRI